MNPFIKFKKWFRLAEKNHPFDHTAFALSTSEKGISRTRMVLLKKILPDGYVFFTNLNSQKGRQFKANNNLSVCFYWASIGKQIRIVGTGKVISKSESDEYFASRPRGSQISAWVSNQSSQIPNRKFLKDREKKFEKKFKNTSVQRPSYWEGIKICPFEFEFWQEGKFRLHEREVYVLKNNGWVKKTLSP